MGKWVNGQLGQWAKGPHLMIGRLFCRGANLQIFEF